jgi:hypothetical protein
MEETRINFDTAKLAKEKGFDWSCNKRYDLNLHISDLFSNTERPYLKDYNNDALKLVFSAPTQSLLQKWILEKHGYFVTAELSYLQWGKYSATVQKKSEEGSVLATTVLDGFTVYDNPENALEEGLQETLKLIKNELVR